MAPRVGSSRSPRPRARRASDSLAPGQVQEAFLRPAVRSTMTDRSSTTTRLPPRLSAAAVLLLAAGAMGCRKEQVALSAAISSVDAKEVVVDVHAAPGMRVGFGMTLQKGEGTATDASGNARLVMPRSRWKDHGGHAFQIVGEGKSLMKTRFGFTDAPLEMPVRALLRIPEAPLWFALLDAGRDPGRANGDGGAVPKAAAARDKAVYLRLRDARGTSAPAAKPRFDEPPEIAPRWLPESAGMPIRIATPPGARVELGAASLDAAPNGLTQTDLPSLELAASTMMETLASSTHTLTVPVRVTKDGATESSSLTFEDTRKEAAWWVTPLVDGVATGKPLPDAQPLVDAVILRRSRGQLLHVGGPGRVAQARWVAREEVTKRKGENCRYNTFINTIVYEDATIRVFDAHAGGEVAKASFRAPTVRCPSVASSADAFVYGSSAETLTEWLGRSMARGWK